MTDIAPDHAAPDDASGNVEAAALSVGTVLREARIQHGLSVDDVSGRIKFAPRQIEALEADDFAHLPETAFLRGFVRSYSRLLQLDPAPLLDALPHEPENTAPLEVKAAGEMPYPDIYTERKYNIIWLAAALAVAVVLALFAWLLGDKPKQHHAADASNTRVETLTLPAAVPVSAVPDAEQAEARGSEAKNAEKPQVAPAVAPAKPAAAPASGQAAKQEPAQAAETQKAPAIASAKPAAAPAVKQESAKAAESQKTPVAPPAKPAAGQTAGQDAKNVLPGSVSIRMTFTGDSWTEIMDKDGKVLMGQLNHAGDERSVSGTPPFTLTFGYASGVKLYYKGKLIDLAPYARLEVAHLTLE